MASLLISVQAMNIIIAATMFILGLYGNQDKY